MSQKQRVLEYLQEGKELPRQVVDIFGRRFGQLLVVGYSRSDKNAYWFCRCDCGAMIEVMGTALRSGNSKSCGHDRQKNAVEASREKSTIHGMEGSATYRSWRSMKDRCLSHTHKSNKYYKNVSICDQWLSFVGFFSDMGERPEGMTLDRVDNSKGYNKGNCRWASPKQQANNRRNSALLTFASRTQTVQLWADETGISRDTLAWRLKAGWAINDALSKPVRSCQRGGV